MKQKNYDLSSGRLWRAASFAHIAKWDRKSSVYVQLPTESAGDLTNRIHRDFRYDIPVTAAMPIGGIIAGGMNGPPRL